jgi:alcohol dehydrogenase
MDVGGLLGALERDTKGCAWTLVASPSGVARWNALSPGRGPLQPSRIHVPARDDPGVARADRIVAFGGGTVIDAAKLLSLRIARERVGREMAEDALLDIDTAHFPDIIAVPTIAGSGAEETPFASLWEAQGKRSVEHPAIRPTRVYLVPELLREVPPDKAIASALDALSHALEATWNRNATDLDRADAVFCIRAMSMFLAHPMGAERSHGELSSLLLASNKAGKLISRTRTALAHSISYPITQELRVAHGIASSFALGEIARFNLEGEARIAAPIARGLGCEQHQIPDVLNMLLRRCLVKRSPGPAEVQSIKGLFTSSPRAINNIRRPTESAARLIALKAAEVLHHG